MRKPGWSGVHFAFMAGFRQPVQVCRPVFGLIDTQRVERIPGKYATIMTVIKLRFNCIVANRFNIIDIDVFFAYLQHLLSGPWP